MCGIIGQINNNQPIDEHLFNEMRDTLTHRGPDGSGTQLLNNNQAALGHRRLSIIDLSEKGHQPMCNEDGSVWVTFNGEIYNYRSLKTELEGLGHTFRSNSDTEVLVHGFEQWGEMLPSKLKGMFAFAIWDEKSETTYLFRDRFGIKPLYYYHDNEKLLFASEIKAIIRNPSVPKELNFDAVSDFFVYRFIPSPKSIWENIYKIPPAHFLVYKKGRTPQVKKYWSIRTEDKKTDEKEIIEQCTYLLKESVNQHLTSDVPVGLFLSGGFDSSLLAYFMHQLNYPTQTFSIGFKDWEKSEHSFAKEVSGLFKTDHHEWILDEELEGLTDELTYFYDEPLGGSSFLPTYLVSKLARKNVKVVLGGDGGDEVFGGYNWHHQIYKKWYLNGIKAKISRALAGNKKFSIDSYWQSQSWANFHYQDIATLFSSETIHDRIGKKNDTWLYEENYHAVSSPVKIFQLMDYHTFLPEVVLAKVDRASMANSLEVRVPFLDHELTEYMMQLHGSTYYKHGTNKYILYKMMEGKLPKNILNKPKKGFGAPVKVFEDSKRMIDEIEHSPLIREQVFNKQMIDRITTQGDFKKIWAMYIFTMWHKKWN